MDPHPEHLVFAASRVPGSSKACATHGDAAMFAVLQAYALNMFFRAPWTDFAPSAEVQALLR